MGEKKKKLPSCISLYSFFALCLCQSMPIKKKTMSILGLHFLHKKRVCKSTVSACWLLSNPPHQVSVQFKGSQNHIQCTFTNSHLLKSVCKVKKEKRDPISHVNIISFYCSLSKVPGTSKAANLQDMVPKTCSITKLWWMHTT